MDYQLTISPSKPIASRFEEIVNYPERFRLLEEVPLSFIGCQDLKEVTEFMIVDFETTGLNWEIDKVIEIGCVLLKYDRGLNKCSSNGFAYNEYQDPGIPIPELITKITGIDDAKVKGKKIDPTFFDDFAKRDVIMIAHNARFDRPWWDAMFPHLSNLRWACTCSDIDWKDKGMSSSCLEYLLLKHGYFYEAHSAAIDCMAVAWLLNIAPGAMQELINNCERRYALVSAFGSPFKVKDALAHYEYKWNGAKKVWAKVVEMTDIDRELELLEQLYKGGKKKADVQLTDARNRFKAVAS